MSVCLYHPCYLAVLGLLLSTVWLVAEDNTTRAAFEQAREQYEAKREAQAIAFKRLQVKRLQALESTLAEAAAYEDAKRCRESWQKLKSSITSEDLGALELRFEATEARLEGGGRLLGRAIGNWKTTSKVSWELPDLPSGGYQVWIEHAIVKAPVSVRLSEAQFFVEGSFGKGATKSSLGYLKVSKASDVITLTVSSDDSTLEALEIRALVLVAQAPSV